MQLSKQSTIILCLVLCHIASTHSVTVNPQDENESSTRTTNVSSNPKNWKPSLYRNNKEIKFLPTPISTYGEEQRSSVEDENPLSKAYSYGQRKPNVDNSEDMKTKRVNLLTSLKMRNNSRANVHHKDSNKIEIKLLAQDEQEEEETTTKAYRRRYRKNRNKHNRHQEKHSEETDETEEDHKHNNKRMINKEGSNKNEDNNKNNNEETTAMNRLFNKNRRRPYGLSSNSRTKTTSKTTETPIQEEIDETDVKEEEEHYKINLNVNKKGYGDVRNSEKENENTNQSKTKHEYLIKEEIDENVTGKDDKDKEKTDKLIQKYKHPYSSTLEKPIEIISTHNNNNHDSVYYTDGINYKQTGNVKNSLSNMQLLNSLGMRKVRQPNPHSKRHQQQDLKSKSRSQYNLNSDSQMYIVKLPPQPYYFVNDKAVYNMKSKNTLPIQFNNNGKIDKVYHYNLPLVEKYMTGRKTYNNKVHKIHDPNQAYLGSYNYNEYDSYSKKPNDIFSNTQHEYKSPYASKTKPNITYKFETTNNEQKKIIPVHEDNLSGENIDKSFESDNDFKKFNSNKDEFKHFNTKTDYDKFNPSENYNKFNAHEYYDKFDERKEYDKFSPSEEYDKFEPNDDFKTFDSTYEFKKFNPSSSDDFKSAEKVKPNAHSSSSNKGSKYGSSSHMHDSNIINIKPSLSPTGYGDKSGISDKNFRTYERVVKSSSISPIYMKPYVHRYYTNNGKPKSIYILPQYSKT